jgi:hypothetical protein
LLGRALIIRSIMVLGTSDGIARIGHGVWYYLFAWISIGPGRDHHHSVREQSVEEVRLRIHTRLCIFGERATPSTHR